MQAVEPTFRSRRSLQSFDCRFEEAFAAFCWELRCCNSQRLTPKPLQLCAAAAGYDLKLLLWADGLTASQEVFTAILSALWS